MKHYYLYVVTYILIQNAAAAVPRVDPLVDTKLGLIRGLKLSDGQGAMFLGIPYAIVDRTNPFGSSLPPEPFNTVFEAYEDSEACPQKDYFGGGISGSLDCLRLNIYVPNDATSQNRLPVLVWIHGGGWTVGSGGKSEFGPKYIVRHNVILVSINYRLGPYGFMCLDNPRVPGNQGLKDQLTALKWIKDNIEAFGGDINKITIFGESAGAASVGLLLHYQKGEKLFHQAIMQSGGPFSPSIPVPNPDRLAPIKLAQHLGFETTDEDDALDFLANVDSNLVIAAFNELDLYLQGCVENNYGENVTQLIDVHPINANHPNLRNTPVIIGINNREELLGVIMRDLTNGDIFRKLLGELFNLDTDGNNMEELVRHFYVGDEQLSTDTISDIIDFRSDFKFNYPVVRSINKYLDSGAENLYQYVFSYDGKRNMMKVNNNIVGWDGAAHGDDLGYLFDSTTLPGDPTPEDQLTIDRMTTLWTNFAKYGNPTPETSELLPVAWSPVTRENLNYLNIDNELTIKQRIYNQRTSFIELFYKLFGKYEIGFQDDNV